MIGTNRCWIRLINRRCCRKNAKRFTPLPRAGLPKPCRKAKPCWISPSPVGNRRAVKLPNCSNCWTSTGLRPYAMPSKKHWSGTRPALLLWLSCCGDGSNRHPPRRPRSISAATPKRKPLMFNPTTWRPTMNSPTTTTMTPMNNHAAQLGHVGLRALPANLDDFVARTTKGRWSPRMLLEQLAQAEAEDRSRRSLERRLRVSGIKNFKPMVDYEWTWPTKIERDVIERALTLDFLPEARNLVLVGRNGLCKTMIAKNICHAAVFAGSSVLFRSAPALLEELHRQTPEGRRHKLRIYANVGLLCIDEVGYLSFDDKAADLLYEVINRRYERKSLIVTTNRPFKEWNEVFPNATCIATLLDRLLHHADVTLIEGDSYRVRESAQERRCARELYDRSVPLPVIESAFLLASLRRLLRPADVPPLSPIRSLAYFQPVIAELLSNPAPENYLDYLRFKLHRIACGKNIANGPTPAVVQKTTFSDDR